MRVFRDKTKRGLVGLLRQSSSPRYHELWSNFWDAYLERSHNPTLRESGRFGDDGLVYALRHALMTYVVLTPLEQQAIASQAARVSSGKAPPLLEGDLERIAVAIYTIADDQIALDSFALRVSFDDDIDVENISDEALRYHLASAIESYAERRDVGTTPD